MSTHAHIPLLEGNFYHVYNRGNDGVNIFYQEKNYSYFLKRYDEYLSDYIDTYAYSLLPNHFHLLIKVREKHLFVARKDYPTLKNLENQSESEIVSELFRRFFMSYSKSINEQEKRKGSLFQKPFKRKLVDSDHYFTNMIYYIHTQLSHHGFVGINDKDYAWNSYNRIMINTPSKLKKEEVISWFGNTKEYEKFHRQSQNLDSIKSLMIEE